MFEFFHNFVGATPMCITHHNCFINWAALVGVSEVFKPVLIGSRHASVVLAEPNDYVIQIWTQLAKKLVQSSTVIGSCGHQREHRHLNSSKGTAVPEITQPLFLVGQELLKAHIVLCSKSSRLPSVLFDDYQFIQVKLIDNKR